MRDLVKLSVLLFGSMFVFTSCSVVMAARKEGTSIDKVQSSRTRGQILSYVSKVVSSDRLNNGDLIEVYQVLKERGCAARAFMHGILDVSTLGLWEVVGTPIESFDTKEYFTIKVYYSCNESIQKVELM